MPKARGGFSITLENTILTTKLWGAWDENVAHDYMREYKKVVEPVTKHAWCNLVLLEDWVIGTPEMEPVIRELVTWCYFNGIKASAMVYSDNALKNYQLNKMVRDQLGGYQTEHFKTKQLAVKWLNTLGFYFDADYNAINK